MYCDKLLIASMDFEVQSSERYKDYAYSSLNVHRFFPPPFLIHILTPLVAGWILLFSTFAFVSLSVISLSGNSAF